eukprot:491655_1
MTITIEALATNLITLIGMDQEQQNDDSRYGYEDWKQIIFRKFPHVHTTQVKIWMKNMISIFEIWYWNKYIYRLNGLYGLYGSYWILHWFIGYNKTKSVFEKWCKIEIF